MLRIIEFEEGASLIVETDHTDTAIPGTLLDMLGPARAPTGLPAGSEPVSTTTSMRKAAALLQEQVAALGALARATRISAQPSEIEIQAHTKFVGSVAPIPVLTSATGEAVLKFTLKWHGLNTTA